MRILMLSWEYPPKIIGGISRVVYHLAKELAACGDHVTVITVNDEKDETEEFSDGVRVFRMPPTMVEPLNFSDGILQMNFMFIAKAVSLCREEAFDIIHLHDWLVAYAGYVLKKSFPASEWSAPFIRPSMGAIMAFITAFKATSIMWSLL
jgi:glycosyltransferase involved in cell wall biosynthesis